MRKPLLFILIATTLICACGKPGIDAKSFFTANKTKFDSVATMLMAKYPTKTESTLTFITEDIDDTKLYNLMKPLNFYNISMYEAYCDTAPNYDEIYFQMANKVNGYHYYYIYSECNTDSTYYQGKHSNYVPLGSKWSYYIEKE